MNDSEIGRMQENLFSVYGKEKGHRLAGAIDKLIEEHKREGQTKKWVDEKDIMLITYGDSIKSEGNPPLATLKEFLDSHVKDTINSVHILPFYPYTSDDGFSVQDYLAVDLELGDWGMIHNLSKDYDLMFDGVINHISSKSEWFRKYLEGDKAYQEYFIEADPSLDYSSIVRPRALPLLTKVKHAEGERWVWTTFSEDQIDLNYESEALFMAVLNVLAQYVSHGARYLRLDAIGFLWKRLGTTSIHLEETHRIVQVMRSVVEAISPGTIIITETNVPHEDNISYFGNGFNEAHMVYQFPLPPLTLYAFISGNASHLLKWANSLEPTSEHTSYFNFLASHDGVGLRPVEGILQDHEIDKMVERTKSNGGYVSYKDNGDGTKSPYELNINYFSAMKNEGEDDSLAVARFMAAQTILLSVQGVPGIYIHSLLGSENDHRGVEKTGRYRSINREKLRLFDLESELEMPGNIRRQVFEGLIERIEKRKSQEAFHPNAEQRILFLDDRLFSLVRHNQNTGATIMAIVNVSDQNVNIPSRAIRKEFIQNNIVDFLSDSRLDLNNETMQVAPYQTLWLKEE